MSKVNANVPKGNDQEKEEQAKKAQGCVGIIVTLFSIAAIAYSIYVLVTV